MSSVFWPSGAQKEYGSRGVYGQGMLSFMPRAGSRPHSTCRTFGVPGVVVPRSRHASGTSRPEPGSSAAGAARGPYGSWMQPPPLHTSPQRRTEPKALLGVCATNRTRSPLRGLRGNVTTLFRPFILLKCVILFAYLDLCGSAAFAQERSHTPLPLHVEDDPLAGRLPCDFAISGSLSTHPSFYR